MAKREEIRELMLSQSIRELLYSFRKNGGDLEYCIKEIKEDFLKAGWKPPEQEAP